MSAGEREIYIEITTIGDVQRVAAVDAETGVEVVIQAPAGAALADVRALALRKLERALGDKGTGVASVDGRGVKA